MKKVVLTWILATALAPFVAVAEEASAFEVVYEHYDRMRIALVNDNMPDVEQHAGTIAKVVAQLQKEFSAEAAGIKAEAADDVQGLLPAVEEAAAALAKTAELEAAREAFYGLTKPLVRWREATAAIEGGPVVAYCPMAQKSWLQAKGEITNPYYGQSMANCGAFLDE